VLDGRGDRYLAFVDGGTLLEPGWLDGLVNDIEFGSDVFAATVVPETPSLPVEPCAADGRCSLFNVRDLPSHVRFGHVDTVNGALVDLSWRAAQMGLGVRAARGMHQALAAPVPDAPFVERFGCEPDVLRRADLERLESACADAPATPTLASIVLLSWNAREYTKSAVESIRAHTGSPYEIIIVDNGSDAATREMLASLPDVHVIYNPRNMGFAHGCNQGIAAANGTHIVLLNNDVIVTDGFIGNVMLKLTEGAGTYFRTSLRETIEGGSPLGKLGALLLRPAFAKLQKKLSYDTYGGAPLLGLRGNCIVAHGRSNRTAIRNAIAAAAAESRADLIKEIAASVERVPA